MTRRRLLTWLNAALLARGAALQEEKKPTAKPTETEPVEPPEEDAGRQTKEYAFNPLQAARELKVGNYYFRKGSHKAAAQRFLEASRWDPSLAEAYLRLGEAREKLKDIAAAHEAYAKYLELAPDARNAADIRRKLAGKR